MGRINSIGSWFEKITNGWVFGTQLNKLIFRGNVEIEGGVGNYEHTFQNKDGILAHLDDIPAAGGIPKATAVGTDIYTATVASVVAYIDGDAYLVRFTNGNTTGCTLNINSLGAVPLFRNNDGALLGGDITTGAEMLCVYNLIDNNFQVIGTSPNSLFAYVTNDDSVTITKGQPVYAFSGTGDRMTVKRASNIGDATSAQTVGLVLSTSIAKGQKGIIIIQGLLDGLSILPLSTYADGQAIYLGSTSGSITNIKPYAPNHLVYLGVITTASNGSAGRLYVRVQNGYELDELHDVQAQSPTLKDTLYYDNTVSPPQWKTSSISTILGYTPVSGTGANGQVSFWNGTNSQTGDDGLFWDNTNKRLGVNTVSPATELDIRGKFRTSLVGDPGGGTTTAGFFAFAPSPFGIVFRGYSSGIHSIQNEREANPTEVYALALQPTGGNVLIGTTTSSTYKLDVNGTARVQSSFRCDGQVTFASSVIGTTIRLGSNPQAASSVLDVQSTTQGFLPPRMTTTQRNAIATPATGLLVYDSTLLSLYQYNGTAWVAVGGGGGSTPVKLTSQTLTLASWTLVGSYYEYSFSNVNVTTTCDVAVTPQNASYQTAYNASILPYVAVAAGVATFYAQFPPAADMTVDIVITQTI